MGSNRKVRNAIAPVHAAPFTGDIPAPICISVPLADCYREGNYRESIATDLALLRSLCVNGQLPVPLPVVSRKEDGRCLVLCGNRRTHHMEILSNEDSLKAALEGIPEKDRAGIAPRSFPTVAVIQYRGLNASQEDRLRNDDINPLALNDWEKYQKIISLYRAGLRGREIETQMGKGFSHGTCERLLLIYELGPIVEMDFYNRLHDKDNLGLIQADYLELGKAWRLDNRGVSDVERREAAASATDTTPNAGEPFFKRFGSASQEVWDKFVDRASRREDGIKDTARTAGRSKNDHTANASAFAKAPITSGYARWAAGDETVSLRKLYEAEMALYRKIAEMEEVIGLLTDQNVNLRELVDSLKAELASMRPLALTHDDTIVE